MAGVPASGMVGISVAIALQATAIAAQGVQAGQVGEPTMMPSWPHTEFGQREFPDRGRLRFGTPGDFLGVGLRFRHRWNLA